MPRCGAGTVHPSWKPDGLARIVDATHDAALPIGRLLFLVGVYRVCRRHREIGHPGPRQALDARRGASPTLVHFAGLGRPDVSSVGNLFVSGNRTVGLASSSPPYGIQGATASIAARLAHHCIVDVRRDGRRAGDRPTRRPPRRFASCVSSAPQVPRRMPWHPGLTKSDKDVFSHLHAGLIVNNDRLFSPLCQRIRRYKTAAALSAPTNSRPALALLAGF